MIGVVCEDGLSAEYTISVRTNTVPTNFTLESTHGIPSHPGLESARSGSVQWIPVCIRKGLTLRVEAAFDSHADRALLLTQSRTVGHLSDSHVNRTKAGLSVSFAATGEHYLNRSCLLYTSPSPRDS
eukprot:TRINITY_DN38492_c0_g1_i1.p1 TRINITY_DN38492_c0_g1~~TRINITY_DN38492_c0_g1_i1.p1  ORF type:complete len:127 (+),score=15.17 TRINITY_DN38492_c0_g1_i1:509-889(+)